MLVMFFLESKVRCYMSVATERKNAVIRTEDFLLDLTNPEKTPRIPKEVRRRALHLLQHYPSRYEMELAARVEDENPVWYQVFSNKF